MTTIYQRNIISLQYETKICIFLQNDTYVNIKTEPENRSCLYLKSIGKVYIRRILTKNPLDIELREIIPQISIISSNYSLLTA